MSYLNDSHRATLNSLKRDLDQGIIDEEDYKECKAHVMKSARLAYDSRPSAPNLASTPKTSAPGSVRVFMTMYTYRMGTAGPCIVEYPSKAREAYRSLYFQFFFL